jgi:hypothetical protein
MQWTKVTGLQVARRHCLRIYKALQQGLHSLSSFSSVKRSAVLPADLGPPPDYYVFALKIRGRQHLCSEDCLHSSVHLCAMILGPLFNQYMFARKINEGVTIVPLRTCLHWNLACIRSVVPLSQIGTQPLIDIWSAST